MLAFHVIPMHWLFLKLKEQMKLWYYSATLLYQKQCCSFWYTLLCLKQYFDLWIIFEVKSIWGLKQLCLFNLSCVCIIPHAYEKQIWCHHVILCADSLNGDLYYLHLKPILFLSYRMKFTLLFGAFKKMIGYWKRYDSVSAFVCRHSDDTKLYKLQQSQCCSMVQLQQQWQWLRRMHEVFEFLQGQCMP